VALLSTFVMFFAEPVILIALGSSSLPKHPDAAQLVDIVLGAKCSLLGLTCWCRLVAVASATGLAAGTVFIWELMESAAP